MSEEQNAVAPTSQKAPSETKELTVGPIQVAVTVTVKSSDPGEPPDTGTKAGLGPRKR